MKPIASGKLAHVAGRYAEHAPMATACCNACRTCVSTNALALAAVPLAAALTAVKRLARPAHTQ
jgi:hypothetical protein